MKTFKEYVKDRRISYIICFSINLLLLIVSIYDIIERNAEMLGAFSILFSFFGSLSLLIFAGLLFESMCLTSNSKQIYLQDYSKYQQDLEEEKKQHNLNIKAMISQKLWKQQINEEYNKLMGED